MIRQIEKVVQGALKAHSQPKSHYDDRMHLAQGWNKFPGLDDHAVSLAVVFLDWAANRRLMRGGGSRRPLLRLIDSTIFWRSWPSRA